MEIKWFFVIFGLIFTVVILSGMYFIGSYTSTQEYAQFQESQQKADERFNISQVNHNNQTNTVTNEILYLSDRLNPILDQIPNATQSKIDQDIHYNQTSEDFEKIAQVLEIKLEDHVTLSIMNQSINKILQVLNNTSGTANGTIIPVPVPIVVENITEPITPIPIPGPLVNNITEDRGLPL